MNMDRTGAFDIPGKPTYSSKTKHVVLRFFFRHELVKSARITTHHVNTHDMVADIATKQSIDSIVYVHTAYL